VLDRVLSHEIMANEANAASMRFLFMLIFLLF